MEKKKKLAGRQIKQMIKSNDFSFLMDLEPNQIISLCVKFKTNKIVGELAKLDFERTKEFIKYLYDNHISAPIINKNLILELLKANEKETIKYLTDSSVTVDYMDLVDNSNLEEVSDILVNSMSEKDFRSVSYSSLLRHSFAYTHAYFRKNITDAFKSNHIKEVSKMKDSELEKILALLSERKFIEMPREYLLDERVLERCTDNKDDRKTIIKLLNMTEYTIESEELLLDKINGKFSSVEDLIKDMHKRNLNREDMSIYELLAFEVYARKKLYNLGIYKSRVNVFSNIDQYGSSNYSGYDKLYNIMISYDGKRVNNVEKLVGVINHEIAHCYQDYNVKNMNMNVDIDIDLYSKDYFIRHIAFGFIDAEEYYEFNYSKISEEYMADVISKYETDKFLYDKKECLQRLKDSLANDEKFLYKRDLNRFFWGNYHLNDFFEDNFDYVLEKRGKENVKERLKEEAPILLIEYDINKKEIPRRRSIDELLEIMKNSDDKKVKQACMGLLISRFDIYKEKESDLENNKKHLEKLISENKIDKNVSNVLTSYIKSRETVAIKKR